MSRSFHLIFNVLLPQLQCSRSCAWNFLARDFVFDLSVRALNVDEIQEEVIAVGPSLSSADVPALQIMEETVEVVGLAPLNNADAPGKILEETVEVVVLGFHSTMPTCQHFRFWKRLSRWWGWAFIQQCRRASSSGIWKRLSRWWGWSFTQQCRRASSSDSGRDLRWWSWAFTEQCRRASSSDSGIDCRAGGVRPSQSNACRHPFRFWKRLQPTIMLHAGFPTKYLSKRLMLISSRVVDKLRS